MITKLTTRQTRIRRRSGHSLLGSSCGRCRRHCNSRKGPGCGRSCLGRRGRTSVHTDGRRGLDDVDVQQHRHHYQILP